MRSTVRGTGQTIAAGVSPFLELTGSGGSATCSAKRSRPPSRGRCYFRLCRLRTNRGEPGRFSRSMLTAPAVPTLPGSSAG